MTHPNLFRASLAVAAVTLLGAALPASAQAAPPVAPTAPDAKIKTKNLAIVLFPKFETLDVFGPVEMWGRLEGYKIVTVSEHRGVITSAQGVDTVTTYSFADAPRFDIIMIPGGMGTRTEVNNPVMLDFLRNQDAGTEYTTSVCTGSAVLAKAGLLDGHKATSNKMAWAFVTSQDGDVIWQPSARWVEDGKYVTSSGISAGIDMALALIEDLEGREKAENVAKVAEYIWNDAPADDPFAVETGRN